jgi:hypothetical protein
MPEPMLRKAAKMRADALNETLAKLARKTEQWARQKAAREASEVSRRELEHELALPGGGDGARGCRHAHGAARARGVRGSTPSRIRLSVPHPPTPHPLTPRPPTHPTHSHHTPSHTTPSHPTPLSGEHEPTFHVQLRAGIKKTGIVRVRTVS